MKECHREWGTWLFNSLPSDWGSVWIWCGLHLKGVQCQSPAYVLSSPFPPLPALLCISQGPVPTGSWMGLASRKLRLKMGGPEQGEQQAPSLHRLCSGGMAGSGCGSSVVPESASHNLHDFGVKLVVLVLGCGNPCVLPAGKAEAPYWCSSWRRVTSPHLASWLFSYSSKKFPVFNLLFEISRDDLCLTAVKQEINSWGGSAAQALVWQKVKGQVGDLACGKGEVQGHPETGILRHAETMLLRQRHSEPGGSLEGWGRFSFYTNTRAKCCPRRDVTYVGEPQARGFWIQSTSLFSIEFKLAGWGSREWLTHSNTKAGSCLLPSA